MTNLPKIVMEEPETEFVAEYDLSEPSADYESAEMVVAGDSGTYRKSLA